MKDRIKKKPDPKVVEHEDNEVDLEVGGPSIASGKKSKILVITASSILITGVVYFMFFKGDDGKKEKLQEVVASSPTSSGIAPSDSGKSPFAFEPPTAREEKNKNDVDLLDKPATPDVPALPVVSESANDDIKNLMPEPEKIPLAPQDQALKDPNNLAAQQVQQQPATLPAQAQLPVATSEPEKKKSIDPRYSPIVVFSGASTGPANSVGYNNNIIKLNESAIDKLEKSKVQVKTTYVADRAHAITQGKLLTAVLETAINTEIPGSVRAIISHDVYGESGNEVLIPRGSRLYGAYSTNIIRGQGRVNISWSRLIRPDGVDLATNFNASDQFGRSGVSGEVDNKYGPVLANSLLTSVLAVGGALAAEMALGSNNTATTVSNPAQGTVTTTGRPSAQVISDVSRAIVSSVGQVLGNALDVTPSIRVPQGTKITVIVNADMSLPPFTQK